jgi:mevalonate kinase
LIDQSPLARAQAPGKIILFGEHAVVYGRPAIAVPVQQVHARAEILPADVCTVEAVDLHQRVRVADAPPDDPFARIVQLVCEAVGQPLPPWRIRVTSEIPIAAGLGSSAAISAAIARAMLAAFDIDLDKAAISALVFEVEKLHHGTPSGIDNTVVVYERPVWFVRGQPPRPFAVARPIHLLIADTGIPSPTKITVGDVRRAWEQDAARYEALFNAAGDIARQARSAI